jgi:hypothetical protein
MHRGVEMERPIVWPLKIAITDKFKSQFRFAQHLGEHESTVSKVIRGAQDLGEGKKKAWAEALGVENYKALFPDETRS